MLNYKRYSFFITYIFSGALALGAAVYVSSHFIKSAHSQNPPAQQLENDVNGLLEKGPEAVAEESSQENYELFLVPYNYDPRERRDPFVKIGEVGAAKQLRPLMPLEQYELSQIRLIGIMWKVNNPKAMFMDPDNQVHVLGKDQRIGRNQGYIAVIREGEVVVVEASDNNGEAVYSSRVLRITK